MFIILLMVIAAGYIRSPKAPSPEVEHFGVGPFPLMMRRAAELRLSKHRP